MRKVNKAFNVLMAMFPSYESWLMFVGREENTEVLNDLIDFARREGLLTLGTKEELEALINQFPGVRRVEMRHLPVDFGDLLERRKEFLNLSVSLRSWVKRINALLDEHRIRLPRISNTMITRLKKEAADTAYKQDVLRSIAFWIGYDRPQLVSTWNYEVLRKICEIGINAGSKAFTHGVRIGFSLSGRGEVVDHEVVGWLRKTLKDYLESSKDPYLHAGKVKGHDITTLYVDFPREEGSEYPSSYRYCLRSAMSLAHQIAVRWSLSPYYSEKRFLAIGLAGGDFSMVDTQLLPILSVRIPGDPIIRITDFIRQCLLINDVRVILSERPYEVSLFNGEVLFVWWVHAFWNTIYFDFIPELLSDPVCATTEEAKFRLNRLLFYPEEVQDKRPNALSIFFRFPSNSLLGQEIAKTLYFRRRFWEALEVMRVVVGLNPDDPTARTFRMAIYRHLALSAPSWKAANAMLRFALHEARYVEDHCSYLGEDYYCEYAGVYLEKAILALKFCRQDREGDASAWQAIVFDAIREAALLFNKGMAISPSGVRSTFLLHLTLILRAVLNDNPNVFTDAHCPLYGRRSVIRRVTEEVMKQGGFVRDDIPGFDTNRFAEDRMITNFEVHDAAVALEAYRPTTYFCHAVALWDFTVVRRIGTARRVHKILGEAKRRAEAMMKKDVCIRSYTRLYEEILPVPEFVSHMDRCIALIESRVGEGLFKGNDDDVIPERDDYEPLLMTLNF
ncbi:MAG: hypothetical protein N2572_01620 [Syntrophales bacterium]|nr:hypothetical protein [Syntrophales bacterium]